MRNGQAGPIRDLSPLILALDSGDLAEARADALEVREYVDVVKVGLQLFLTEGPDAVDALKSDGFEVFLDLKLHDIPNTVASAIPPLCRMEPLMMTVHTTGGREMMRAAVAAVSEYCEGSDLRTPLLIGVTVLTSLNVQALKMIGFNDPVEKHVLGLARLANESGLDGLVTSPLETLSVRKEVGAGMLLITPGVRLAGVENDDQARVATPGEALRSGADFFVAGRPLTKAADPKAAAREMLTGEMGSGLES